MKKLTLVVFLLPFFAVAQLNEKQHTTAFTTITSAGFLAGESGVKLVGQLSAGFSFSRYFAGVGAGYDAYRFNSLPLFADLRVSFNREKTAFLYVNPGYNFSLHNKNKTAPFIIEDNVKGGLYMETGIGYRVKLNNKHNLSFSGGYSFKKITEYKKYAYPICGVAGCTTGDWVETYKYPYKFGRIIFKMSWEMGK